MKKAPTSSAPTSLGSASEVTFSVAVMAEPNDPHTNLLTRSYQLSAKKSSECVPLNMLNYHIFKVAHSGEKSSFAAG